MAVTRDDILAAYRLLLGREPSEQEATVWLHVQSIAELREIFLSSGEGMTHMRRRISDTPQVRLPLDNEPIQVDADVDAATQAHLLQYVTETWTALGKTEPHWSVLAHDAFKAANVAEVEASFYLSGGLDSALVVAVLARHGLTPLHLPRAVEYGCGVGRVTPHLAERFAAVTGIDISTSHLRLAEQAVAKANRGNVKLVLARAPNFGMTEPFDLWFCHIVLQHNPPPVIVMVLRRMFTMLAAGGVAIFQVPSYVPGYRFDVREYLAAPKSGTIEVHCLPKSVVFQLAHAAGCVPLEVREDTAMAYPWLSNTYVFRKLG